MHPWHDAKQIAERFEADQQQMLELLLPRSIEFGDDVDDPGNLSRFHAHRLAEHAIANRLLRVAVPRAKELGNVKAADRMHTRAFKMLSCRQGGPVGLNTDRRIVVAWREKCGLAKYCPDEALKEGKRVGDWYLQAIHSHHCDGGRVYTGVLTLPNYPGGRLREGIRYLPKRFRDRFIRPIKNGKNKFGIDGALVIVEAPLGKDRDWNVHLNFILLTSGWLDYKKLREQWGFDIHIKQHTQFDYQGMAGLFNEMIKYSVRALPEKSNDGKHTAPAMVEWTGDELIEWDEAMTGYRRTRAYKSLHDLKKPATTPAKVTRWLGYLNYKSWGYQFVRRAHDLALHCDMLLKSEHFALNLIRGDKSTRHRRANRHTWPP